MAYIVYLTFSDYIIKKIKIHLHIYILHNLFTFVYNRIKVSHIRKQVWLIWLKFSNACWSKRFVRDMEMQVTLII